MPKTVLHVLSQRPGWTGSGTTLAALVREADRAGWRQHVAVGVPHGERPAVGGLESDRIHPLHFGRPPLDFAVPGMSDVMPYPSTRFAALDAERVERYRACWREHLRRVVDATRPTVIHTHHVWLVSALVKDVAPGVPVVTHCHGTGLRQAELCPHLVPPVLEGCARNDAFVVLHDAHAQAVATLLGVEPSRVHVVGAGYDETVFGAEGADSRRRAVLFAGKLSRAKGLDVLLDAWPRVAAEAPDAELHVAGGGAGEESERLRERLAAMGPHVRHHGALTPTELAARMRASTVCALPSFFEGLPLVLVEALACGCRLVATDLPGVRAAIAPHAGAFLERVPLPAMIHVDRPDPAGLPRFREALAAAILRALRQGPARPTPGQLAPFTWRAVFERIEPHWRARA